jgi:hypothetical protein
MSRQTQAGQQAPKEQIVLTTEQAIKEIRNLRAGKLFVGNMEYVDHLLAAYDALLAQIALDKDLNDRGQDKSY